MVVADVVVINMKTYSISQIANWNIDSLRLTDDEVLQAIKNVAIEVIKNKKKLIEIESIINENC